MKSKNLLVLALVAVGILILGLVVRQANRSQWGADSAAVGAPLLPDLPVNDIAEITITGPEQSVTLARREGEWRVLERYGYPADWGQISQRVKQLANETIKQAITVSPTHYGRLELLPPDADPSDKAGTDVTLSNAAGEPLGQLRLGKLHISESDAAQNPMKRGQPSPDGRYILLPDSANNVDSDRVVLVTNPFNTLAPDPTEWLITQFLAIRNLTSACLERDGETAWRLRSNPDSGKLVLAGDIPEDMTLGERAVSETARALGDARINDVADPDLPDSETGMDNPAVFHAVSKYHVACTVKIGAQTGNDYYVRANLTYREPDTAENNDSEPESDKQTQDPDRIRAKTEILNNLLDGWTYLLPQETVRKLIRPRCDFLEKKESENDNEETPQSPTPSTPAYPPPAAPSK